MISPSHCFDSPRGSGLFKLKPLLTPERHLAYLNSFLEKLEIRYLGAFASVRLDCFSRNVCHPRQSPTPRGVISSRRLDTRMYYGITWYRPGTVPDSNVHGPTWGPSGADRSEVGPMLAPWTLLSGVLQKCVGKYEDFGARSSRRIHTQLHHTMLWHGFCVSMPYIPASGTKVSYYTTTRLLSSVFVMV